MIYVYNDSFNNFNLTNQQGKITKNEYAFNI